MPVLELTIDAGNRIEARRSDGAEQTAEFRLEPIKRRMIELFEDWLADGWSRGSPRITRRRELEVLGTLLYDAAFAGPISAFFEESIRQLGASRADPLRVQLSFSGDAETLTALPWEFLYRPDTAATRGYFLATEPGIVLARTLPLQQALSDLRPEDPPLRVLAAAAKPPELGPIREEPTLDAIGALTDAIDANVKLLDEPTVDHFLDAVESHHPHVLHLLAHGRYDRDNGDGQIALLAPDASKAAWVRDQQFADSFGQAGWTPRVVVLHACEGATTGPGAAFAGVAPRLMRAGVQAVVAMQYPISNEAANAFNSSFYSEIGKASPVDSAVQRSRWRVTVSLPASQGSGEFGIPVLFMRSRSAVLAPRKEVAGV
jgi:hypothetical protein